MVPLTAPDNTIATDTVTPSRKEINAIVEANRILETTPEIKGTHHALSILSAMRYSTAWSQKDLLICQPVLAAYRNIANLETSQEYWERELLPLAANGDTNYPYEIINTMMFERVNETVILDHAYDVVSELLTRFSQ